MLSGSLLRAEAQASFVPSGDQTGRVSALLGDWLTLMMSSDWSRLTTQISSLPERLEVKAIFRPVDDQVGSLSMDGLLVTRMLCPVVTVERIWSSILSSADVS